MAAYSKQLTDKQIAEGWRMVKFGDICQEVKATSKDPQADGLEHYIGLEHLDSGSLRIKRRGSIAEDSPSFTKKFSPGHLLFGKRRCYLKKAAVADFEGICSGDIIIMAPKSDMVLPELLPFIVQSDTFWNWAEKTSSGSLSPRTKFKSLEELDIYLPPKDRQKHIVRLLQNSFHQETHLDESISKGKKLIEVIKQQSMNEFAKANATHELVPDVDNGYKLVRLRDLLELTPRPVCMSNDKTYTLVTAKRAYGGIVERDKLTGKEILVKSQFEIKEGDFLISKRQIVHGGCGVVPKDLDGSIVSNEYNVFRCNDALDLDYFKWFVQIPRMRNYFYICSVGVHIEKMLFKTDDWLNRQIVLPSLEAQKKIAHSLNSGAKSIDYLAEKVTAVRMLSNAVKNNLLEL